MADPPAPDPRRLQLLAQDAEDLAIISAALQDAVTKVADIAYEAQARRLTIGVNRFRWEAEGGQRVRSGLQLGGVMQLQARKIRRHAKDAVLEVTFEPGEAPGGTVIISCAGGGDLKATVECVDAILADISDPWPTPRTPAHDL